MTTEQLNEFLGTRLGRNPYGEPVYKWVHSDSFMHFMKDANGLAEVKLPSGLIVMEPTYTERKARPDLIDTWLIAHWHAPEPQSVWLAKYGTRALWPRRGYYTPVDAWEDRGKPPTLAHTERVVDLVRRIRAMSDTAAAMRDEAAKTEAEIDRDERSVDSLRSDIIDDACTAFGALPGSRSGGVSIPMPGVDYSAPFQKQA